MKKKILIIILTTLLLALLGLISIKIIFNKSNEEPIITNNKVEFTSAKEIEICKNKDNCPMTSPVLYGNLEYDYDNKEMQQWLQEINQETENYYQEAINSTNLDETCTKVLDTYNYKYSIETISNSYIGDKYINFTIRRIKYNLCTNEKETIPMKTFLFDKENQKQITQDELKKQLNITDNLIIEKIQQNIEQLNNNGRNLNIEDTYQNGTIDYILYYDFDGTLLAQYYQPQENRYYSATIISSK